MLSVVHDRKRAIEFGALGIISKPLQRGELLRMLHLARGGGETLLQSQHLIQKSAAVS